MLGRSKARRATEAALLTEIGAQRDASRELIERFEREAGVARDAIEAASRAREERDEYRRVLAAAIASERRSATRIADLEEDRRELEQRTLETARRAGAAEAERDGLASRLNGLELLVASRNAEHERALGDLADRAWAEREAARAELVKLATNAGGQGAYAVAVELRSELHALRKLVDGGLQAASAPARPEPVASDLEGSRAGASAGALGAPAATAGWLRARLLIGLGVASAAVGIALVPMTALAVASPERAAFVHLASGVGPWTLIGLTVGAFALALWLLTWARRGADAASSGIRVAAERRVPGRSDFGPRATASSIDGSGATAESGTDLGDESIDESIGEYELPSARGSAISESPASGDSGGAARNGRA